MRDTVEQWDVLRHGAPFLEKEIHSLANVHLVRPNGLSRCNEGFVVCLGDAIQPKEGRWLRRRWNPAHRGGRPCLVE